MDTVYKTLHFSAQAFEETLKFLCLHIYQKSRTGCYPHLIYLKLTQNVFAYSGLRYLFEVLALKTRGIWLSLVYFDIFRVSVLKRNSDPRIALIGRTTLTTYSLLSKHQQHLTCKIGRPEQYGPKVQFSFLADVMNIYKFAITRYNL